MQVKADFWMGKCTSIRPVVVSCKTSFGSTLLALSHRRQMTLKLLLFAPRCCWITHFRPLCSFVDQCSKLSSNQIFQSEVTRTQTHLVLDGNYLRASSGTRRLDYFSTFGHLHWRWKIAQRHSIFAKVGSKFWQIINKPSKIYPWLCGFCQRVEILPNLVTLLTRYM